MNNKELEEKTVQLESSLIRDREQWNKKIHEVIQMLKTMTELPEAQILMLSYRQMIVDGISGMQGSIYKKNISYDSYYKTKFREYSLDYDMKLTGGEKERMIKADLGIVKRQISLLESHLEYYRECIKTLDNMGFAIQRRIAVNNDL
jgi:hypothetical protein